MRLETPKNHPRYISDTYSLDVNIFRILLEGIARVAYCHLQVFFNLFVGRAPDGIIHW